MQKEYIDEIVELSFRLTIRNVNFGIASISFLSIIGFRLTIRNVNIKWLRESILNKKCFRLTIRNVN